MKTPVTEPGVQHVAWVLLDITMVTALLAAPEAESPFLLFL